MQPTHNLIVSKGVNKITYGLLMSRILLELTLRTSLSRL